MWNELWQSAQPYLIGGMIWASAIPITVLLIKLINHLSKTERAQRFDAWYDRNIG